MYIPSLCQGVSGKWSGFFAATCQFNLCHPLPVVAFWSQLVWSGAFFREKMGLSSRHLKPTCPQAHPVAPCFLLTDTLGHIGRTKMKTQQARHSPLSTTLQTWLAIVLFSARVQAQWDSGGAPSHSHPPKKAESICTNTGLTEHLKRGLSE